MKFKTYKTKKYCAFHRKKMFFDLFFEIKLDISYPKSTKPK